MSFLQNLKDRKSALKQTDTIVTCADGTRFIEKHSSHYPAIVPQKPSVGFVIDTAPDDVPSLVIPNLYIGSQDCCCPNSLSCFKIDQVLSVGIEIEVSCRLPNITYNFIPCLDLPETNLTPVMNQCFPIIRSALQNSKNILVHCNAGVSRSASIVIAFLIQEKHNSFEIAYAVLKSARPCIQPNPGFLNQLKKLTSLENFYV